MVETIEITNFSGRLTRVKTGELNSGFAKYSTSFGYDPFSQPGTLTWFEKPVDWDATNSSIKGLITSGKARIEAGVGYMYAIDHAGRLYKITPSNTLDSADITAASVISGPNSVLSGYTFGGGMEFYGDTEAIYAGGDNGVARYNFDGSAVTSVTHASSVTANIPRPLSQFVGNLYFGNGNNLGEISTTSIVSTYQKLDPALQTENIVQDMEPSADLNYLLMAASYIAPEATTNALPNRPLANSGRSFLLQWNGSDKGVTAGVQFPFFILSAIQSFLDKVYSLSMDSIGASLLEGGTKRVSLPDLRPPFPNAVSSNGNFVTFATSETMNSTRQISLFYYGRLDDENPNGLYRVFSISSTQSDGFMVSVPWQTIVAGKQFTINNSTSSVATIFGKHIFSALDVSNGGATKKNALYYWPFPSTGSGTPQLGVYETQTKLFPRKIAVKQIRVYTQPTATNNGFQLDCIGSDGTVITNGSFSYTFAAGTDPTQLQGALERINFNPEMKDTYALGLRITNTGTANMVIEKIEVDWEYSGK